MICHSCGGVVGRDCFNPQECEWIANQMQVEHLVEQEREQVAELKAVVDRMERALYAIATFRNQFSGPSLDYMQGYRDGQEHQARIARKALGIEEIN